MLSRSTLAFGLTMGLSACQSAPDRQNLDLPVQTLAARSLPTAGNNPEAMDAQQIFDWQRLYKTNPSAVEQQAITAQLQDVAKSSSFEDRLKHARNMLAIGRREEAKENYTNLLKEQPGQIDVQLELTHIYLAENNSERAFDYLSSIRKLLDAMEKPTTEQSFRYRYALASAYIQSQNRKKGHQILTDLVAKNPEFIPAYAALAQSYLQQNHLELAEFIAKRGLDRGKDDPRLLNIIAVTCLRRGRHDEARSWIQKALQQNPDFGPALINRAHLSMLKREYALAENDLQRAVSLDALNVDGQMALGLLFHKTGRLTASKGALEKAVSLDPQNPYARYHLGLLLTQEFKDKSGALQLFYDVLQARDDEIELKNLAKIQIQAIRDSRLYER